MELRATYNRHHVSECPLPEPAPDAVFAMRYLVSAPQELTLQEFKAQAVAVVAAAGLPAMRISVQQDLNSFDADFWTVFADESVFQTIAVCANGGTPAQALASFSVKLNTWACGAGLLPSAQPMEGGPACA